MNEPLKKIVVIGATSTIAQHCARLWAKENPREFVLVGRDEAKLSPIATDLRVRCPQARVECRTVSFNSAAVIAEFCRTVQSEGAISLALVAHGSLPDQSLAQTDLRSCEEALLVNGISPVLFAEALAGEMERANAGTLVVIGSVAGDRGRKSNYVYGAAKGLVARYVQGLQHRLAKTNVRVIIVKPGPTDTPMTAHLKDLGTKLAAPEDVAATIVKSVARGRPAIYAPAIWKWIMLVVRHVPHTIFNKTNL